MLRRQINRNLSFFAKLLRYLASPMRNKDEFLSCAIPRDVPTARHRDARLVAMRSIPLRLWALASCPRSCRSFRFLSLALCLSGAGYFAGSAWSHFYRRCSLSIAKASPSACAMQRLLAYLSGVALVCGKLLLDLPHDAPLWKYSIHSILRHPDSFFALPWPLSRALWSPRRRAARQIFSQPRSACRSLLMGGCGVSARPHHWLSLGPPRLHASRQPHPHATRALDRRHGNLLRHRRSQRSVAHPSCIHAAEVCRRQPPLSSSQRSRPSPLRINRSFAARPPQAVATLLQENLSVGAEAIGNKETKQDMLACLLATQPASRHPLSPSAALADHHLAGSARRLHRHRPDFCAKPSATSPARPTPPSSSTMSPWLPTTAAVRKLYNSASFFLPDGTYAGRYDKMHLVPFGEYTPYKPLFFFVGDLLDDLLFIPGSHRSVFPVAGKKYGVFICYESIFGDELRHFALNGAQVLVNISDDGWYGDTSAPWEHLDMARMRAIENHRWVLRATNTGITAAIDPARPHHRHHPAPHPHLRPGPLRLQQRPHLLHPPRRLVRLALRLRHRASCCSLGFARKTRPAQSQVN